MATTYKITTGTGSATYSVSTGARGPQGLSGSDASVTESNVLTAIGDGTRIDAAVMPEIIPVDGLTLADASALTLPVGTLSRKGSRVVLHDNNTPGGLDIDGLVMRGAITHTVTDSIAAAQFIDIASCVISHDWVDATGQLFLLSGEVIINSSLSNYEPTGNCAVLFYLRDATGARNSSAVAGDGLVAVVSTAPTPFSDYTRVKFSQLMLSSLSSTLRFSLSSVYAGSVELRKTPSGGALADTNISLTSSGLASTKHTVTYGALGQWATLTCALYLPPDAATANATGSIRAFCNLRLEKVNV